MTVFSIQRKVFYDDTDGGGVVYHANYLRYMDHARSEFLAQQGFELAQMADQERIVFAVVKVEIDYRLPARLSDCLTITAELEQARGTSLIFRQAVLRQDKNSIAPTLLTQAKVKVVCLDVLAFKPCPIPEHIRKRVMANVC